MGPNILNSSMVVLINTENTVNMATEAKELISAIRISDFHYMIIIAKIIHDNYIYCYNYKWREEPQLHKS